MLNRFLYIYLVVQIFVDTFQLKAGYSHSKIVLSPVYSKVIDKKKRENTRVVKCLPIYIRLREVSNYEDRRIPCIQLAEFSEEMSLKAFD